MCKDRTTKTKRTPLEHMNTSDGEAKTEQRQQIERILKEKNSTEKHPAAEWVLAYFRKEKKPVKMNSWIRSGLETTAINVSVKRQNKDKNLRTSGKLSGSYKDGKNKSEAVPGVIVDLSEPIST